MITDKNLRVSTAQAVTATAVSTDSIDLGVAREMGAGKQLVWHISVNQTATAAGAATVDFEAITADDAALTSNVTVVGRSEPIGKAELVAYTANSGSAGKPAVVVPIDMKTAITTPPNQSLALGKRYLGVRYTVATGPLTAGQFTADLVAEIQDGRKFYASGFTVS